MPHEVIRSAGAGDWDEIDALLERCGLPLAGAREHLEEFVVAQIDGAIRGCAALERYDGVALLRSVAVDPSLRGRRVGERMVSSLIDEARHEKIRQLVLLTTTAENWFPRFGFQRQDRKRAPEVLQQSEEFRGACPETAALMVLELD